MAPSARNQSVAGAVTPALSWPAPNICPWASRYIARSTMIGTPLVDRTMADTSVDASDGIRFTQMFCRLFGPTLYVLTTGAAGAGSRYVTSTAAVLDVGFCSR